MSRVLMFLTAGLFLQGCAAAQLPELTVKPASQYRLSRDKAGLTVSVDPFSEKKRAEDFFGLNLLSQGIFPILVVIENKSDGSTFYLQKDQASLEIAGDEEGIVSSSRSLTYDKPDAGVRTAFYISPLIVASIWQTHENQREATTRSMIKNELRERTLGPNESQHGFLFFKISDDKRGKTVSAVKLKVLNIQSKETLMFTFPVE